MKNILLCASVFTSLISFAQQQVINGSFDTWENVGSSTEEPTNWNGTKTGSGVVTNPNQNLFRETTDVHSAPYSARIESTTYTIFFNTSLVNGMLTTGNVGISGFDPSGGFNQTLTGTAGKRHPLPNTDSPDSLVFWAKYTPQGGAQARVQSVLHTNYDQKTPFSNDGNGNANVDAEAVLNFGSTSGNWQRFSIPFDYNVGGATSHEYVLFSITAAAEVGGSTSKSGSVLLIDDLEFIYVNPPVANYTASATSVCDGQSISFTDNSTENPTSWSWNFGDGNTSTIQNPTHTYTTPGTYTVELTATNFKGSNSTTQTITVNAIPTVTANSDFAICNGESATLNGSGATTYSWDNGVTDGQAFNPTATTTYTVTGTTNGCSNTASVTVTVDNQSNSGTASALSACVNDNAVNLLEALTGEDMGGTWIDTDMTGAITGNTLNATGLTAGTTYNFTYEFAANGACAAVSTATTVTVTNTVSAGNATSNNSTCNTNMFDLFSSISGYSAGGTWNNDNNQGTINASGILDANGVTPGTYNYTYSVDGGSCGTDSRTVAITVSGGPSVSFTGDTEICAGSAASVTASGANTYSWDNGVGSGATQSLSPATTTTYNVTGTSTNGCVSTVQYTLTVNALPTATVSQNTTACQNTGDIPVLLTGSGTAPFVFQYTVNGGANQSVTSTGNDALIQIPSTSTGTSTINVSNIQDANMCSQALVETVSVTINPLPTATISGNATVCVGDAEPQVTITGANATAPYTFTYNIDGGTNQVVSSTGNIATLNVPTATAGSFIYNLVSVQEDSPAQCEQVQIASVTVDVVATPTVTLDAFPMDTICLNASPIALPAGSPVSGTYSGNGVSGSNFDPSAAGIGTHTITYEFGSAACTGTATTMIVVDGCSSIEENTITSFSMLPNPARDNVTIKLNNDINGTIAIVDLSGKVVYNAVINGLENTISVSNLNKGMYFVQVTDENGNNSGEKLMVK